MNRLSHVTEAQGTLGHFEISWTLTLSLTLLNVFLSAGPCCLLCLCGDTTLGIARLTERTLLVCRFQTSSSIGPAWEEPTHGFCSLYSGAE